MIVYSFINAAPQASNPTVGLAGGDSILNFSCLVLVVNAHAHAHAYVNVASATAAVQYYSTVYIAHYIIIIIMSFL
jgi:hypothetical protein